MSEAKFCESCGTQVLYGAGFCANCGRPVRLPQPQSTLYPPPIPVPQNVLPSWLRKNRIFVVLLLVIVALTGALAQSYGQNDALQSQNATLQSRLTELQNEATNYYAKLQTYQSQNSQLQSQVSSLQAENIYLSTQVQQLNLQSAHPTLSEWGCAGSCQMSSANAWSMDATGWRQGGVPDTFTYSPSYKATVPVGMFYLTLGQYVQFADCSTNANAVNRISCVSGTYYYVPATTSLAHSSPVYSCAPGATSCPFFSYDFHLGEGCASYVAIYYSTQVGTIYPDQSVTYNPASTGTGVCA